MYIKKSRVIASIIAVVLLTAVLTTLALNPFGIENTGKFTIKESDKGKNKGIKTKDISKENVAKHT